MTDIHIPPAALEAGARAIFEARLAERPYPHSERLIDWLKYVSEKDSRAAFLAMIEAWEGMFENPAGDYLMLRRNALILPLMENPDD